MHISLVIVLSSTHDWLMPRNIVAALQVLNWDWAESRVELQYLTKGCEHCCNGWYTNQRERMIETHRVYQIVLGDMIGWHC